ncbi:MAG: XrtA/PEP-CTERM system histidine kinase PrsK [Candidatus Eisenbacteria bacterium]
MLTMTSPLQIAAVTASALMLATIGLLGTLRRGHWLVTLLFSSAFLSMAAFHAGALAILHATSPDAARDWAAYMAGASALTSWLWLALSVVLARPKPFHQLRDAAAYLAVALVGCIALSVLARTPYVVREVQGVGGEAVILLGAMGKIYLMYLVVVIVAVLMNLESMLRTAPASARRRLRPMFFAFVVAILADLLIVSGGLLFGGLPVAWLAAGAVLLFVCGVVTALALARRRLSDMSVPVARPVIYYSSVSLTLAGVFLLTMAVLSKVLPVLTPEWKRLASIGFYLLVGGGGLVLTMSPRANRAVKRFVDRNFYANRYDYRREWERVSRAITPTARPEDICRQIEALLRAVFEAERVVVHLRDDHSGNFRRVHPSAGTQEPPARAAAGARGLDTTDLIRPESSLVRELHRMRAPLVFRDVAQDLDLIPVMGEHRPMIQAMGAALCAPLHVGDDLVGLLWMSEKRSDEEYSFEDAEFLGAMSRQLAAALWFARVADQLAETRQLESLNRLSTFVLHDIKNQVSGLSLVVDNARRHLADPEFQRDAMKVVERTVINLKELMAHVSGVGRPPVIQPGPCRVRELLEDSVAAAGLVAGGDGGIRLIVSYRGDVTVHVDRGQLTRVLTNLLTNAREALAGSGDIDLEAAVERDGLGGAACLALSVRDTGPGMTPEFVRDSLFRPFATTKASGLGIGLMQCRGIVEAHGGRITVDSRPGRGTVFEVRVPAAEPPAGAATDAPPDQGSR